MFDKISFGQRLQEIRHAKSLKQQDVAKALGLNKDSISNMEIGKRGVSVETLIALAEYFGVSSDYLLGLSEVRERR